MFPLVQGTDLMLMVLRVVSSAGMPCSRFCGTSGQAQETPIAHSVSCRQRLHANNNACALSLPEHSCYNDVLFSQCLITYRGPIGICLWLTVVSVEAHHETQPYLVKLNDAKAPSSKGKALPERMSFQCCFPTYAAN